jgi:peptidoglycan/xylan/chitin deacetylase (PgdA/CDA1 family)
VRNISERRGLAIALAGLAAAMVLSACGPAAERTPAGGTTRTPAAAGATSTTGGATTGVTTAVPTPATTGPMPRASSTIPPSLVGKDIEVIPTKQKVVALTFDAGANADAVPSILSTLSAQKVPASFFLTGAWATKNPQSVRKLVTGGYRIGNHTATHPQLTKLSDAAIRSELGTGRSQIIAAGGTDPIPLFRFPFGDRNARTISVVNKAGYVAVRWSVDTLGWKGTSGGMTKSKVISRAVGGAKPGEIILMHVGSNPDDKTMLDAAALPTIITRLKALGYGFVSLEALLAGGGTGGGGVIQPGCDRTAWRSAPISVSHDPKVPPVPVVTGIRTASHPECRYDRLVLDVAGPLPGYQIRSVSEVIGDPSGQPVPVPGGGTSYLLITLQPAQAHTDDGQATVARRSAALGYPALKGYAISGDVEGHLSIALGLVGVRQIRTGELTGRWYIDVAH